MKSQIAVQRISRRFAACEEGSDRLLADAALLLAELTTARVESDARAGTGQRAIQRVVEAQRSLSDAQSALLRAHADMLRIGTERGDIADGECPPAAGALTIAA